MTSSTSTFVARPGRLGTLAVAACFLPILVIGAVNLPLHPDAPAVVRVLGWVLLSPVIVFLGVAVRIVASRGPVIEIDGRGLLWRRWSERRIPWSAVERWQVRDLLGKHYVTLWLKDRAGHPSTTVNALLAPGNRWLGFGDITLSADATDRRFADLVAAVRAHAPGAERAGPERAPG